MSNNPNAWTAAEVAALEREYATGIPYSSIAKLLTAEFGTYFTKNMIVGRVARLGLAPRPRPPSVFGHRRNPLSRRRVAFDRIRVIRAARMGPSRPRLVLVPPCVGSVPLLDLAETTCKYPTTGEGLATLFCGAEKPADGRGYCFDHHALCYQKTVPKRTATRDVHRNVTAAVDSVGVRPGYQFPSLRSVIV